MANAKKTDALKAAAAKTVADAKEVVKTGVEAASAKIEEVKAEAEKKAEPEVKAEEKAEDAPKKQESVPAKAAKTVKKAVQKAEKKSAETKVYVQFGAGESDVDTIVERIKAEYVEQGHRASAIKDLRVYLKPEDGAAYYVINEKVAGRVDLF